MCGIGQSAQRCLQPAQVGIVHVPRGESCHQALLEHLADLEQFEHLLGRELAHGDADEGNTRDETLRLEWADRLQRSSE